MPEMSVLPAAPAMPAVAGAAAATPQAPRDPSAAQADPGTPSFLTQLQSALASIGLIAPPATPAAGSDTGLPAEPTAHDADASDDALAEMLAALGFVPVPVQLPTVPLASAPEPQGVPSALQVAAPLGAHAAPLAPRENAALQPADPTSMPVQAPQVAPDAQAPAQPQAQTQVPAEILQAMTPVQPQALPREVLNHQAAPTAEGDVAPRATHAPTAAEAGASGVTLPVATGQPTADARTSDSSTDDDRQPSDSATPVDSAAGRTDAPAQPFANVAPTAHAQRTDAPADVKSAHVVNQIAHQADLYRLPGGRGVRIQLHPDDLGGVGVTIKYGATGGLELHLNVEHAATAELVQSGWSDLRHALSMQGIATDNLIMSVSGPTDANLSNSQGGSYRSDAGQAGFGQAGQQAHQGRDGESRAGRGWNGLDDAPSNGPDEVRATSAASNARIDYRV